MHIVDEIFRDFKDFGYFEDLRQLKSKEERFTKISEIVSKVNVFKAEIQDLTIDEQLYLDYLIQQKDIDLGLCPDFYIFFSSKNNRFHKVCQRDKGRAYCNGKINECRFPNN